MGGLRAKGRRGGVVPVPHGKTRITIRIDTDVLDWLREQVNAAGGGNYQTSMNDVLRRYIEGREELSARVGREGRRDTPVPARAISARSTWRKRYAGVPRSSRP